VFKNDKLFQPSPIFAVSVGTSTPVQKLDRRNALVVKRTSLLC